MAVGVDLRACCIVGVGAAMPEPLEVKIGRAVRMLSRHVGIFGIRIERSGASGCGIQQPGARGDIRQRDDRGG